MRGLSMEMLIQMVFNFWPIFVIAAVILLMIFRITSNCRRLEIEIGVLRARMNELLLMFQEVERGSVRGLPEPKRERKMVPEAVAAAAVTEQAAPSSTVSPPEKEEVKSPEEGKEMEASPAPVWPETPPEPPENLQEREDVPQENAPPENFAETHWGTDEENREETPPEPFGDSREQAAEEAPPEASEERAEDGFPPPTIEAEIPPSSPPASDRSVVPCPKCGHRLAYKKELSGKKVRCPSCKAVIELP